MRRVRGGPVTVAGLLPLLAGAAPVASADQGAVPPLVDASERTGLLFHHVNGMTGLRHLVEMTGAGGGWIDFDGDGDLDALLVQGGELDADREPLDPWQGAPGDVLLRNDLAARGARFVDWTDAARLDSRGYGMGVATGDADGDGLVDLLITNFGVDELWRNRGDGTFEDASTALGPPQPGWSTSATFVDYDGDGDADLYIGRYVDYPLADPITCYAPSSRVDYCGPSAFPAEADRLLRNRGDGSFEDVTGPLGVDRLVEPTLGVVALDVQGDGRQEIYVATCPPPGDSHARPSRTGWWRCRGRR